MVDRVQLLRLTGQLENRTRALFRLQSRMRGFPFNLDREDARSFPARLHSTTGRRRLHHKRATHRLIFRHLLDEGPARQTPDLFITRQNQCHSILRRCLQLDERSQHFDRECAVCFYVEDAWSINLSCVASPRTFTLRAARVNSVSVSDHQDLLLVSLKRSDYEMLTEVRDVYTLDRIDAREFTCRLGQHIDNRTTAFHIT